MYVCHSFNKQHTSTIRYDTSVRESIKQKLTVKRLASFSYNSLETTVSKIYDHKAQGNSKNICFAPAPIGWKHNALIAVVSVCPGPDFKSKTEERIELKICRKQAQDTGDSWPHLQLQGYTTGRTDWFSTGLKAAVRFPQTFANNKTNIDCCRRQLWHSLPEARNCSQNHHIIRFRPFKDKN